MNFKDEIPYSQKSNNSFLSGLLEFTQYKLGNKPNFTEWKVLNLGKLKGNFNSKHLLRRFVGIESRRFPKVITPHCQISLSWYFFKNFPPEPGGGRQTRCHRQGRPQTLFFLRDPDIVMQQHNQCLSSQLSLQHRMVAGPRTCCTVVSVASS